MSDFVVDVLTSNREFFHNKYNLAIEKSGKPKDGFIDEETLFIREKEIVEFFTSTIIH